MKRIILLFLILFIFNACEALKNEDVELYDETFQKKSKNWEVELHLRELNETWKPEDGIPYEEINMTLKYLDEIDKDLKFHYLFHYGDPVRGTIEPNYKITLYDNQAEYTETMFQQRMIEEVCFGTLTLEIHWEDHKGKSHAESFVFKDNQNSLCKNIILMAPRGDINY